MWHVWTRRLLLTMGLLLGGIFAGQWARAQFVHEWFRWLKPRVVTTAAPISNGNDKPATAYVVELNGHGVALKRFDCWMRSSDAFGFEVLRAPPYQVRW